MSESDDDSDAGGAGVGAGQGVDRFTDLLHPTGPDGAFVPPTMVDADTRVHCVVWAKESPSTDMLKQWRALRAMTQGHIMLTVFRQIGHVLSAVRDPRCRVAAMLLDLQDGPAEVLQVLAAVRGAGGLLPTLLLVRSLGDMSDALRKAAQEAMALGASQLVERPSSQGDLFVLARRVATLVNRHAKADIVFNQIRSSTGVGSGTRLSRRHLEAWRAGQGGDPAAATPASAPVMDGGVTEALAVQVGRGLMRQPAHGRGPVHPARQGTASSAGRSATPPTASTPLAPQRLAELAASAAGRWTSAEQKVDGSVVTQEVQAAQKAVSVHSVGGDFGIAARGAAAYTDQLLFPQLAGAQGSAGGTDGDARDEDEPSDAYQSVILAALAGQGEEVVTAAPAEPDTEEGRESGRWGVDEGDSHLDAWGVGGAGTRGAFPSLDAEWVSPHRVRAVRKLRVVHHDALARGVRRTSLTGNFTTPLSSPFLASKGSSMPASAGMTVLPRHAASTSSLHVPRGPGAGILHSLAASGRLLRTAESMPGLAARHQVTGVLGHTLTSTASGKGRGGEEGAASPPPDSSLDLLGEEGPRTPRGGAASPASEEDTVQLPLSASMAFASAITRSAAQRALAASQRRRAAGQAFTVKSTDGVDMSTAWMGWMGFDLLKGSALWPSIQSVSPFSSAFKWLQRGLGATLTHTAPASGSTRSEGGTPQSSMVASAVSGLTGLDSSSSTAALAAAAAAQGGGGHGAVRGAVTVDADAMTPQAEASALASFKAAVRVDAKCAVAHHLQGVVLLGLGRFDEALAALHRCLAPDPSAPGGGQFPQSVLPPGTHAAALARYGLAPPAHIVVRLTQALWQEGASRPPPPKRSGPKGKVRRKQGISPAARAAALPRTVGPSGHVLTPQPTRLGLDSGVSWQPPEVVALALYNRALARCALGDLLLALDDTAGCLQLEPHHPPALRLRAMLRRREGDFSGAVQDYTAAVSAGAQGPSHRRGSGVGHVGVLRQIPSAASTSAPGAAFPGGSPSEGEGARRTREQLKHLQELSTLFKPGSRVAGMLGLDQAAAALRGSEDGAHDAAVQRLQAALTAEGAWPSPMTVNKPVAAGGTPAINLVLAQEQEYARKLTVPNAGSPAKPSRQVHDGAASPPTTPAAGHHGGPQGVLATMFQRELGQAVHTDSLAGGGESQGAALSPALPAEQQEGDSPRAQAVEALGGTKHSLDQVLTGLTDVFSSVMCTNTELVSALAHRCNRRPSAATRIIKSALSPLIWFRRLQPGVQEDFAQRVSRRTFPHGATVIAERAPMPFFLVVMSGAATVKVNVADADVAVGKLGAGDIYGHLSLLFGASRTLTIVAAGTLEVLTLPAVDFMSMRLDRVFNQHLSDTVAIFRSTGAFDSFSDEELQKLASTATLRAFAKGSTVLRQGALPSSLCVLTRGILRVTKDTNVISDLQRLMGEAEARIKSLLQGATFHSSMRHGAKLAFAQAQPDGGTVASVLHETSDGAQPADASHHVAAPELKEALLPTAVQAEVAQLRERVQQLQERQDSLRKEFAGSAERESMLRRSVMLERALPPFLFGEAAVLEPWSGLEPGNVIADTYVEVLQVSRSALPHHYFNRERREALKAKAMQWPRDDTVLLQRFLHQQEWQQYKQGVVASSKGPASAD